LIHVVVMTLRTVSRVRFRRAIGAVLAACAVATIVACGARAGAPSRAELLSTAAPRSTACTVEAEPTTLPGVDAVVDSAALVAALPPPDAATEGGGHVLLTLAFDRDGLNVRRDVVEQSVGSLVADSVQRLVFANRRQLLESDEAWGVRMRIDLGDSTSLRVGRREFCPPAARSPQLDAAMHRLQPVSVRYRDGMRERVLQVRARVSEAGIITATQITRGELQGSTMERSINDFLRQFLFEPATIDGVPAPAWIEIPVRVRG
jgi:hypothetical protein